MLLAWPNADYMPALVRCEHKQMQDAVGCIIAIDTDST
jgi:hypothetical protein